MTDTPSLHTLSVLVDNEAGVLSQVSRLFSRKGFNIESLAVGPTDDPALSRITIEVLTNENQTQLVTSQLSKLVPVHSVRIHARQRRHEQRLRAHERDAGKRRGARQRGHPAGKHLPRVHPRCVDSVLDARSHR